MSDLKKMTVEEVNRAITAGTGVCLLDVRTPAEFGSVHIAGAVSMPVERLDCAEVAAAAGDAALRVVMCQGGLRAVKAMDQLAAAGQGDWVLLEGGVKAWGNAGLPLERGAFALPLERQVFIAAGLLVVVGVVLGHLLHPNWYVLSGLVGLGLTMAGLTGFCPMGMLMARMPWNQRDGSCCAKGNCCGA